MTLMTITSRRRVASALIFGGVVAMFTAGIIRFSDGELVADDLPVVIGAGLATAVVAWWARRRT